MKNSGQSWPDFGQLENQELLQLAKLTTRHICFLRPDIIKFLVEDNERHREEWCIQLKERGVEPTLYLWENSSCAFPGVRRHAGSGEIAIHKGQKKAEERPRNALALDDNSYPKQIWSFIFQGKKFGNKGPPGYSLTHLADHKDYKNRASDEFVSADLEKLKSTSFGLYTSPTNTVYLPNGLMRPTDFSNQLRNLVLRKAQALYQNFCKLWPSHYSLKEESTSEWSLDSFDWREPVGTRDHIQSFLDYRKIKMEKLFESKKD